MYKRKKQIKANKESDEDNTEQKKQDPDLITAREMYVFLATIPLFVLSGGYFVAKIIHFLLFDKF